MRKSRELAALKDKVNRLESDLAHLRGFHKELIHGAEHTLVHRKVIFFHTVAFPYDQERNL